FKAPFDDLKLRQAVGYAINPEEINKGVVGGQAKLNKLPIPYGLLSWSDELANEIGFTPDPEKAKSLLDEAGWVANGDGVRQKDGKSLDISLWTNSSTLRQKMSEVIQFQLAQVGFNVTIQPIDLGSFLARLTDGEADIYLLQRGGDDPDTLNYTTNSDDSGIRNYQAINPDFKALIERGRATTGAEERVQIYEDAMRMYMGDAGLIPLFTFLSTVGLRSVVKDVKFSAYGAPVYNDAYVEQ
ncbi:MAG: ABC transporter substrate-binding protein, partial [Thermomicrobiales bacterium]